MLITRSMPLWLFVPYFLICAPAIYFYLKLNDTALKQDLGMPISLCLGTMGSFLLLHLLIRKALITESVGKALLILIGPVGFVAWVWAISLLSAR